MENKRAVSSVLVGLILVASPAFASESGSVNLKPAKVGIFGIRSEKRAAKRELKAFLKANPGARGRERFAPGLVRAGGVAAGLTSATAGVGISLVYALGGNYEPYSTPLLVSALALPVLGFKLARSVARNTNTMAVNRAIDSGVEVSPAQLARWSEAGLIRVDAQ